MPNPIFSLTRDNTNPELSVSVINQDISHVTEDDSGVFVRRGSSFDNSSTNKVFGKNRDMMSSVATLAAIPLKIKERPKKRQSLFLGISLSDNSHHTVGHI